MRKFLLITVFILAGCDREPAIPTPNVGKIDQSLVGNYHQGAGLGTNLSLTLESNGKFECSWRGCLGHYGSTKGVWRRDGEMIAISTSTSDGMFESSPLTNLQITIFEDASYLLQESDCEFMNEHDYGDDMIPRVAFRRIE